MYLSVLRLAFASILLMCCVNCFSQQNSRQDILLADGWRTVASDKDNSVFDGFEKADFNTAGWVKVSVPRNWDRYEGYRRLKHGNRHGYAWYRKTFTLPKGDKTKRYFLWFEGVGSYATVWLNGKQVGDHPGGRTSFTLDITDAVRFNADNILAVRAGHPAYIQDLPWVCGGCSDDRGFSEGSQPMGIFRPVHLIVTNAIRIEPFGVHIWNDETITKKAATLFNETEIKNYSNETRSITVVNRLTDKDGKLITEAQKKITIPAGTTQTIRLNSLHITHPHLWSLEDPYLYKVITRITENGKVVDEAATPYGIRWISWPIGKEGTSNQFFLNGKPVFINGTCEYEHNMGRSHAFTPEEIQARVGQIKAAGFNAFRDAHQPHNLLYQHYWDSLGILWWPQFSAHIWYDTPAFRKQFKTLLKDWIKERRNSPSAILWGLQNESRLPEDFARECTEIIRALDPTASKQRLVTTCNGGSGTDWDVPQNWTGTYGGDPATYASDIKRQLLIGEYGAWRSLDVHTEGPFEQNGILSEDRMAQLMEQKIRLAESVKDSACGQFHWLFSSHENPGRTQSGEGYRELDRVGPINYKGLLTPWGEPLDAYYMFRANYAPKDKEPMVYIVSHTWPDRWTTIGKKDSIIVYSNCDEVELFNDIKTHSLGKRTRNGIGTHFQWDNANINYNVLYAEGKVDGKVVACDYIVLHHLPQAPHWKALLKEEKSITAPQPNYQYLYRVNCGGADYTDVHGNVWMADRKRKTDNTWGSLSWTDDYTNMPFYYASQRSTNDIINGTADAALFQSFRYGLDKLQYAFPVPDGDYWVELYFTEPWYGTGGGMDCTGWRLFDVAINEKTVLKNVDIWKEVGHDYALKKVVKAHITGGRLIVSFPRVAAGQAIISAIAIASLDKKLKPALPSPTLIQNLTVTRKKEAHNWTTQTWCTTGNKLYSDRSFTIASLPPGLYGAEYIKTPYESITTNDTLAQFTLSDSSDVYMAMDARIVTKPRWLAGYEAIQKTITTDSKEGRIYKLWRRRFAKNATVFLGANGTLSGGTPSMYVVFVLPVTHMEPAFDLKPSVRYEAIAAHLKGAAIAKELYANKEYVAYQMAGGAIEWTITVGVGDTYALHFRYFNHAEKTVAMHMKVIGADGTLMTEKDLEFPSTAPGKWGTVDSSTGTMINAGTYRVILSAITTSDIGIGRLEVQ